jgi:hypothetical protein
LLLKLAIINLILREAKLRIFLAEEPEELAKLVFLHLLAIVSVLGELLPNFHEADLVILEPVEHVVLWQVILLKLLDNNKNKQVEHHVRADQDKQDEVDEAETRATVYVFDASPSLVSRAVKHYTVPVLSG